MNAGKSFEHQFQKSLLKDKFYTLRLIDPPSSFGKDSTKVRFSAKNPYDFVAYKYPTLFCLELKSVIGTSVSFQTEEEAKQKKNTSANIKWHQIKSLLEAAEYIDVNAMFIINFRKTNKTYAVPIEDFISFITSPDFNKKSINEDDCDMLGLLIPQKLNRTTYHYDFQHIYDIIYEEFYDEEDVDLGKEYEVHCESIDEDEIE
nr:MAG TPA: penicillin-binding protein-related factor A [Caudoviricetes sp.]